MSHPKDSSKTPDYTIWPKPVPTPHQADCHEIADGSGRWFAYTQTRENADKIVAALAASESTRSRLVEALEEANNLLNVAYNELSDLHGYCVRSKPPQNESYHGVMAVECMRKIACYRAAHKGEDK